MKIQLYTRRSFDVASVIAKYLEDIIEQIIVQLVISSLKRLIRRLLPSAKYELMYMRITIYKAYWYSIFTWLPRAFYAPFTRHPVKLIPLYPLSALWVALSNYYYQLTHIGWTEEQKEWEQTCIEHYPENAPEAKKHRLTYWRNSQRTVRICIEDQRG